MNDKETLIDMLNRATSPSYGAWFYIAGDEVSIITGPDDAVADFRFAPDGTLREVQVSESGPLPSGGTWHGTVSRP
jgi:hypothetical protein